MVDCTVLTFRRPFSWVGVDQANKKHDVINEYMLKAATERLIVQLSRILFIWNMKITQILQWLYTILWIKWKKDGVEVDPALQDIFNCDKLALQ